MGGRREVEPMSHCSGGEDKHSSLPRRVIWTRGQVKLWIFYDGTRNCTKPSPPSPLHITHHLDPNVS